MAKKGKVEDFIYLYNKKVKITKLVRDFTVIPAHEIVKYLLNKEILELEKQNLQDSKEVLSISMERYKVGKANLLETIESQKNLEDAQVRYIEALYAIKMAETDLLKANGNLIK